MDNGEGSSRMSYITIQDAPRIPTVIDLTTLPDSEPPRDVIEILDDDEEDITVITPPARTNRGSSQQQPSPLQTSPRQQRRRQFQGLLNAIFAVSSHYHPYALGAHHHDDRAAHNSPPPQPVPFTFITHHHLHDHPSPPLKSTRTDKPRTIKNTRPGFTRSLDEPLPPLAGLAEKGKGKKGKGKQALPAVVGDKKATAIVCARCEQPLKGKKIHMLKQCGHVYCGTCVDMVRDGKCEVCGRKISKDGAQELYV